MSHGLGAEQEKRTARALSEMGDWRFAEGPRGWIVQTRNGCYEVTERGSCTCPDFKHRCCGTELRCAHVCGLRHLLLAREGRTASESPIAEALAMSERDAAFDRIFG